MANSGQGSIKETWKTLASLPFYPKWGINNYVTTQSHYKVPITVL